MGKEVRRGKAGKGRGEGAGWRGGRYKGEERGRGKIEKKLATDTHFDLARKGRYLNQSWLEYRKKTL